MMTKPEMTTHKASNNRPRVRSPKRREKHPADQIKARDDDTMRAIGMPLPPLIRTRQPKPQDYAAASTDPADLKSP